MAVTRPTGWNDRPIPRGKVYSDFTNEQIDQMVDDPSFAEKCLKAENNMKRSLNYLLENLLK